MKSTDEVSNLISCLTNDEDLQQDLWVHYLSGTPTELFEASLERLKVEYSEDIELRNAVWNLIQNPPSEKLSTFLENNFSDYERGIIFCLMLGLQVSRISHIKGISEVRVRQSIATIRYNSAWSKYGIKEEPDRR